MLSKDIEFDEESDSALREALLKKFIETIKVHKNTFQVEFLASQEQREHFLNALNAVSYQVT
ncbi:MAG: hypothetical protein KZQ64_05360 [gamma proteobacterium symbiont of Bathyaustriella thionipta]|nr:hypothetical protein [gamma proteobacterium symbiont of Bathyaustriella thionipta]MCU7949110.1 hypothetical protein [gamma proteobacterium symbiont of Bathyaustriella thionipta]MCU7952806.1 hypothetical protein [gamma proteobacterium symbiont of Bathyaustriella thionipta]MCU7955697.1 hypothetical protein [gamma proteobacterium symbiont of Bathyaustriella thionipta]MCU7968011.1 hypothetical protein [gamma proteobacterium symbiont of Bathyaustriella thionipta]